MRKAIQIKENVYWVGVQDFNLRHFHGSLFPIEEGSTYNAYLIVDEEITLIDTVEEEFVDIMFERIESVIGDKAIDHLVVQHAEPDHSGGFVRFMEKYPNCSPYASSIGINNMLQQYFGEYEFTTVATDETLNTGKYTMKFLEMPMIHWPDNMLTYLVEEKIAFSNDAFGQHIASYNLYDCDHGKDFCLAQAKEYYANILVPYNMLINAKINIIKTMDIDMICPAHGIIWKTYVKEIIDLYERHSLAQNEHKATIVYESVWSHTQQIAEALAEGLAQAGVDVKIYKKSETNIAVIMREILDSKAVFIGSGCYNSFMSMEIAGMLDKLKSCNIKDKKGLGFGAYGWYMNTAKTIEEKLAEAGLEIIDDGGISKNFTPSKEAINEIIETAYKIGIEL
ncbi:MAG: FprA family A-type flavoprotein [Erysipelotrichales bacterium]